MNVALVLYGQPRFFEVAYHNFFSKIIRQLNADVFFHTWWSEDMVGTTYPVARHAQSSYSYKDLEVTEDIPSRLLNLYNPVAYTLNDWNESPGNDYQYYSQWQAKELVKWYHWHEQYDLIIRSRFDIMCNQDIDFVADDNLWLPQACAYKHLVNDMFSFSNYENFDKITDTYLNLDKFDQRGMEYAFSEQIIREAIPVSEFPSTFDTFYIYRSKTARQ